VTRTAPVNGVRICTSQPTRIAMLERGLTILADLLAEEPALAPSVV
jgi:hypothetical protein